jgi:hypothetical protein
VDSVTGVFPVAIERNTVHCRTIPLYSYFSIPYDVFYDFPGNYLEVEDESTSTAHLCHWGESESIKKISARERQFPIHTSFRSGTGTHHPSHPEFLYDCYLSIVYNVVSNIENVALEKTRHFYQLYFR